MNEGTTYFRGDVTWAVWVHNQPTGVLRQHYPQEFADFTEFCGKAPIPFSSFLVDVGPKPHQDFVLAFRDRLSPNRMTSRNLRWVNPHRMVVDPSVWGLNHCVDL